jgi:aspartate/methionine/tyrosine aminotransferase
VALTPGTAFAADESCVDYLRIPFVLDESAIAAGVDRVALAWSQYRMLNAPAARTAPLV